MTKISVSYRGYLVPPELAVEFLAKLWRPVLMDRHELREAMQTPDDIGGCLVPPEYVVELAVRLGMPRLPDRTKWDDLVHARIWHKPRWWQWLFHNYSTNKAASFLVWRWPKFPHIVNAYDECCQTHQEETEHRRQKAHEFFQGLRPKHETEHGT